VTPRRGGYCRICKRAFVMQKVGRPRVVCPAYECEREMERRRWNDTRRAAAKATRGWWLSLSDEQRAAAGVWMRDKTPPKAYLSRHDWAFHNRAEVLS
jgi:hypothetical protein